MTMHVTGVDKEDVIASIEKFVCLDTYAALAQEAKIHLHVSWRTPGRRDALLSVRSESPSSLTVTA